MKELLDLFPTANDIFLLTNRQLDFVLLEFVIARANGDGITLPKYLSRGELENVYGVSLSLPADRLKQINERLMAAYQRLLSGNLTMPAPGQPDGVVTVTPNGRSGLPPEHKSLLEWTGGARVTLAIVFTDIVGSTALNVELGDTTMSEVRRKHFAQSTALVTKYFGYEVKTIGDSVMAVFRSVEAALDYARALQLDPGSSELRVRAGIHIGPVEVTADDIFGAEVALASRVVGAVADAEIWLSSRARQDVDRAGVREERWQPHDVNLKGIGYVQLWSLARKTVSEERGPKHGPVWSGLAEVAAWVRACSPTATGPQICNALENSCASGRIKARGRRRVYPTEQVLRIDPGDPHFIWFADEHGDLQPWQELIPSDEWEDLTFFARPTPADGEQYRDAVVRALNELSLAVELRSKSRSRLAWANLEFSRDEVMREWPAP